MKPKHLLFLAPFLLPFAAPVVAQQNQPGTPMLLRGTIDSVEGNTLAMTTRSVRRSGRYQTVSLGSVAR